MQESIRENLRNLGWKETIAIDLVNYWKTIENIWFRFDIALKEIPIVSDTYKDVPYVLLRFLDFFNI